MAYGYNDVTSKPPSSLKAIKACLNQLQEEAENNKLMLAANLINAASQAIDDEIATRSTITVKIERQHAPMERYL